MIKRRTIYLAGPMEHVSTYDASSWRNTATAMLKDHYDILDPCRRLHNFEKRYMKRIFELDLRDIREADILLVNLNDPKLAKHGTSMEVFYASYTLGKPVVAFKAEHDHIHPFFESLVTEWRSTVDKACETLIEEYL